MPNSSNPGPQWWWAWAERGCSRPEASPEVRRATLASQQRRRTPKKDIFSGNSNGYIANATELCDLSSHVFAVVLRLCRARIRDMFLFSEQSLSQAANDMQTHRTWPPCKADCGPRSDGLPAISEPSCQCRPWRPSCDLTAWRGCVSHCAWARIENWHSATFSPVLAKL